MSAIEIRRSSIVDLDVEAVVNAANRGLSADGGVSRAIFEAAGREKMRAACRQIGRCDAGCAVITSGFEMRALAVIHAVGPVWSDGQHGEAELLRGAYRASLALAVEHGCKSVGFPLLSAGVNGCPVEQAWREALRACREFLDLGHELDIVFAVRDDGIFEAGRRALRQIAPQYAVVTKADWDISDMPDQRGTFILSRHFTPGQMAALRRGFLPRAMEDRWFWYMEGDTLFAHRSWTGHCVYRVDFARDDAHRVTVNRDPAQYAGEGIDDERAHLNELLSRWCAPRGGNGARPGILRDRLTMAGREWEAIYFHRPEEPHGFLSNWYPSHFELDGIRYSSAEQYIMHQKCAMFGDVASAQAVLATDDVRAQQAIGRKAQGFVDAVWAGRRQLVAVRGLLAKFSQNAPLKQKLLDTGDAFLVECAHSDTIWACGIRLNEEARRDAARWRGQNTLGFALMEVRALLRAGVNPLR